MFTSILSIISGVANSVANVFKLKSAANVQRREAESDVASLAAALAAKKQEIRSAVYESDDTKLNEIAQRLLPSLLAALLLSFYCLSGCRASSTASPIYIPTDRKIESCTNSLGIACKAVPNAVMVDMLARLEEYEALKTEKAVDKRLEK